MSPAVVVPSMMALDAQGYGVSKGIPTLVIAASSIDDVICITGFGVVLGISFSTGGFQLFSSPTFCAYFLFLLYLGTSYRG